MRLEIQINEELLARVDRKCEKGTRSAWISEAIKEKLSRSKNEDANLKIMVEQIREMDPSAIHGTLSDLVYTAQVIFKENKKQNEVLKLIYESAALGGTFAYEAWKDGEDEKYAEESKLGILKSVEDELLDMKFMEKR